MINAILFVALLASQTNIETQGCRKLDSGAAQYITFVRSGLDPAASEKRAVLYAWLRLSNNTTCSIGLIGENPRPLRQLEDGAERFIYYEMYDSARFPYGAPEPKMGDSANVILLDPGHSVVFKVPIAIFKAGRGLAVPFRYSWDNSITSFSLRQYVYLVPEELPKEIRGRLRRP